MFLKLPTTSIADFDFHAFACHVLDHSPAVETRSQLRLVMKAVDAISEARRLGHDVAELPDDAAKAFARACEHAPIPRLSMQRVGASGAAFGEPIPVPARSFDPFYEAVEGMTDQRPEPVPAELPAAAE